MAQTIKFTLDKETNKFQRYSLQEGDIRGTLYVAKELAGDVKEIPVEVEIGGK